MAKRVEASLITLCSAAIILCSARGSAQDSENLKINGKTMKLGEFVEFSLSVKDVNAAQKYYESLGFKSTVAAKADHPASAVTDGNIVLALHQAEFQSPTLTYYGSAIDQCMQALRENGVATKELRRANGKVTEAEFIDLNGQRVVLKAEKPPRDFKFEFPDLMNPSAAKNSGKHFSRGGMFGEFAIPVKDRPASAAFWQKLGFRTMHESDSPYPWGIYSDDLTVFGFHQTSEFKSGAITFFSKNSAERIAALKKEGFEFIVDIDKNNSILKSPDGQMIYVFGLP